MRCYDVGPVSFLAPSPYLFDFFFRASTTACSLNKAASFTVKTTCILLASVLIESVSTHGRVAMASRTFAGQEAQVMPGTSKTT